VEVRTLTVGGLGTNCYIVVEGDQCLVIDPGDEGERILRALAGGGGASDGTSYGASEGASEWNSDGVTGETNYGASDDISNGTSPLRVQAILLTHAHFDHTLAARYLQEKTGAPVYVGAKDKAMLSEPGWMKQFMPSDSAAPSDVRTLGEGDRIALGGATLEVWETPGHSPGSLTYVLNVEADAAPATPPAPGQSNGLLSPPDSSPMMVFCGDLIFRRGVGRTDLPGGDSDSLFESVDRVLELPPDTLIYPGHGPTTTVKHEKAANPFL